MNHSFSVDARLLSGHQQAGAAQSRHYTSLLLAVAATLVGAQLRLSPMTQNRFHQDEALYASFARFIASGPGRGLLLSHMVVDKPPLSFYLNGLSVAIFGPSEFALRLPTVLASILSLVIVFAIGQRLYGAAAGLAAAWAMALSPLAIQFSITIFVDPLLTTWLLLGILLLVRGRPGWAALALSLAWATKQTALLFVPLALVLGVISLRGQVQVRHGLGFFLRAALPLMAGVALVTLTIIVWDQRRGAPISLYQQGFSDNTASRLATPSELKPRGDALLAILHYVTGNDWVSGLLLAGLAVVLWVDLRHRSRAAWADWLLVFFACGCLGGYWLVSLNLFDRYFLPLVPLAALLAGRVFDQAAQALARGLVWLSRRAWLDSNRASRAAWLIARVAAPLIILAILIPQAAAANYDFAPIGGDHGALDGVDDTARFIHTLPRSGVLYDHWLTWEFDYYLFDRPLIMVYYPTPAALTRELAHHSHRGPNYLVMPWWAGDIDPRPALAQAGYGLRAIHRSFRRDGAVSVTLYQLVPAF